MRNLTTKFRDLHKPRKRLNLRKHTGNKLFIYSFIFSLCTGTICNTSFIIFRAVQYAKWTILHFVCIVCAIVQNKSALWILPSIWLYDIDSEIHMAHMVFCWSKSIKNKCSPLNVFYWSNWLCLGGLWTLWYSHAVFTYSKSKPFVNIMMHIMREGHFVCFLHATWAHVAMFATEKVQLTAYKVCVHLAHNV